LFVFTWVQQEITKDCEVAVVSTLTDRSGAEVAICTVTWSIRIAQFKNEEGRKVK
jgi:hypothetical protein